MDFDEDGCGTCSYCGGEPIIDKSRLIRLREVCPKCKGRSKTDWIAHAMGRRVDENDLKIHIVQDNIMRLIEAIREEGDSIGMDLKVTVEPRRPTMFSDERYSFKTPYIDDNDIKW